MRTVGPKLAPKTHIIKKLIHETPEKAQIVNQNKTYFYFIIFAWTVKTNILEYVGPKIYKNYSFRLFRDIDPLYAEKKTELPTEIKISLL